MKLIYSIFFLAIINITVAQKSTPEDYLNNYIGLAQKEMVRTGVPAAITLAQGILESESGNSELAAKSNNHFGIKCKSDWTGEKVYHNDDARGECFRKYTTVEESYIDHSNFLKNNERYAFLFELETTDYYGWAKGLKKAGYATNPKYAQSLIDVIEKYELHKYNDAKNVYTSATTPVPIAEMPKVNETNIVADPPSEAAPAMKDVKREDEVLVQDLQKQFDQKPFKINATKAINVLAGTSFLALANHYKIDLDKLLAYNDLPSTTSDIMEKNCVLFLKKKRKQGETATHTVKENETLHTIAQIEGIKLESLLLMNKLKETATIKVGDVLVLQGKAKK